MESVSGSNVEVIFDLLNIVEIVLTDLERRTKLKEIRHCSLISFTLLS